LAVHAGFIKASGSLELWLPSNINCMKLPWCLIVEIQCTTHLCECTVG